MIVGTPGSGKSTLARNLGQALGLPVVHMDREVHWLPGWVERDRAEKLPIVDRIIARDAWVFEGGHSDSYPQRLARAQMLIWTDAPLPLRLWRVTRRAITGLGRTRPDLADDCPERLRGLPELWRYMLTSNRRSATRLQALYDEADIPKHRLRSLRAIDTFLKEI